MSAPQLDPQLLEILACPSDDHAPVEQRGDTLVCTSCGRVFPIVAGIPVLLLDEALRDGALRDGALRDEGRPSGDAAGTDG